MPAKLKIAVPTSISYGKRNKSIIPMFSMRSMLQSNSSNFNGMQSQHTATFFPFWLCNKHSAERHIEIEYAQHIPKFDRLTYTKTEWLLWCIDIYVAKCYKLYLCNTLPTTFNWTEKLLIGIVDIWHSYIPASRVCAHLICIVHSFSSRWYAVWKRWSFVYVYLPTVKMWMSRCRIQETWNWKIILN